MTDSSFIAVSAVEAAKFFSITDHIFYFFFLRGHFLLRGLTLVVFGPLCLLPDTGPFASLLTFLLRTALTCYFSCAVSDVLGGKSFVLTDEALDFFLLP